jgi:hypothetical protein
MPTLPVIFPVAELDCDRGLPDEASFGRPEFDFRELDEEGVPEARFLQEQISSETRKTFHQQRLPLLDHICFEGKWTHNSMKFLQKENRLERDKHISNDYTHIKQTTCITYENSIRVQF